MLKLQKSVDCDFNADKGDKRRFRASDICRNNNKKKKWIVAINVRFCTSTKQMLDLVDDSQHNYVLTNKWALKLY